VGRHPCHCYGKAAAPARTGARQALWQQLQHCGACGNGTPPYLRLYLVRTDVSDSLESIRRHYSRPPLSYPRTRHCSGTRRVMMAGSLQDRLGGRLLYSIARHALSRS
jgi:hypothetical protein